MLSMTKKKGLLILILFIFAPLLVLGILHKKEQSQKEARFDHFMNYWYAIIEHNCNDIEIYTRMKKSIILDYIENHEGRYIDENVPLYEGGYFPMRKMFNIENQLRFLTINHMSVAPILSAPNSRLKEKNAFREIFSGAYKLLYISEYDEELEYNPQYLYAVFEKIDSLAYEIQKNFILLEKYRTTQHKGSNANLINNIPLSEYSLENY